jgi:hypothetical protein
MEMRGHAHTPADLPPGKEFLVCIESFLSAIIREEYVEAFAVLGCCEAWIGNQLQAYTSQHPRRVKLQLNIHRGGNLKSRKEDITVIPRTDVDFSRE